MNNFDKIKRVRQLSNQASQDFFFFFFLNSIHFLNVILC